MVSKNGLRERPKVFMIGMGGTVAAKEISSKWHYGHFSLREVINMYENVKHNFDIKTSNLFRLDSTDTQPEHWIALANIVHSKLEEDYDGIVITHGTDTMHYTASVLSFLIQNLNVPVVFTGSQILPTLPGSDAPRNLFDSLMVASLSDLAEVSIVFNGQIFRANRTKKVRAADFEAYRSSPTTPLGFVQHGIIINGPYKKRGKRVPKFYPKLETEVAMFEVHPGFNPALIEKAVDWGAKGIIIRGYGVGNYPIKKNSLTPIINHLAEREIPVVLTSQCRMGQDWKKVYFKEIGDRYNDAKIILGYDMMPHTALVKLMWVLGQTNNFSKVKKMMQTNYAGEITSGLSKKKN